MRKRLGLIYAVLLTVVIAFPTLRWLLPGPAGGTLYGYVDEIPSPPPRVVSGFFHKSLQHWIERYYDVHLGFRVPLVRSFNELNFRLFHAAPRLRLVSTPERGLYSGMSIDSLNDEVRRKAELEQRYSLEAEKLLRIQNWLKAKGKHFEVIISSSKPYIYPEPLGSRYLEGGSDAIVERAARFGRFLEDMGVNVIDSGPMLRGYVKKTGIDTHPASGVHWNYYAGCLVAKKLYEDIRSASFPASPLIDCGEPLYGDPHWVDVDGLLLLNILSDGNLKKSSPFPQVQPVPSDAWKPSIVFIGDSFSDQIRYALQEAKGFSRMIMSSYFHTREVDTHGAGGQTSPDLGVDDKAVQAVLARDIAASDVVILQMVDYNVSRWSYGFADYFLEYLTGGQRQIPIVSVAGAYGREGAGPDWWYWIRQKGVFVLEPFYTSAHALQTHVRFEYETRGKQNLNVIVRGSNGREYPFTVPSTGDGLCTWDKIIDLPPGKLLDIGNRLRKPIFL